MHRLPLVILASLALLWSCSSKIGTSDATSDKDSPTMVTTNVNSYVSDSGVTRYHLVTDLWLMFDNAEEPYWFFPYGLHLEQLDDSMQVAATVVADSARYLSREKLWRLDGNVRMRNVDGDKFLTQQLFWNQLTHKVYSDSFVHIERTGRILEGYGFESNEQITAYTLHNPTGIFPGDSFNRKQADQ